MAVQMTDVIFLKVDVDVCDDVAEENGITAMPTFVFFKESKEVIIFNWKRATHI